MQYWCMMAYTGGDHIVSRLNKLLFITKKRIQIFFTTLILLVLLIGCGTLLTSFAVVSNGIYSYVYNWTGILKS